MVTNLANRGVLLNSRSVSWFSALSIALAFAVLTSLVGPPALAEEASGDSGSSSEAPPEEQPSPSPAPSSTGADAPADPESEPTPSTSEEPSDTPETSGVEEPTEPQEPSAQDGTDPSDANVALDQTNAEAVVVCDIWGNILRILEESGITTDALPCPDDGEPPVELTYLCELINLTNCDPMTLLQRVEEICAQTDLCGLPNTDPDYWVNYVCSVIFTGCVLPDPQGLIDDACAAANDCEIPDVGPIVDEICYATYGCGQELDPQGIIDAACEVANDCEAPNTDPYVETVCGWTYDCGNNSDELLGMLCGMVNDCQVPEVDPNDVLCEFENCDPTTVIPDVDPNDVLCQFENCDPATVIPDVDPNDVLCQFENCDPTNVVPELDPDDILCEFEGCDPTNEIPPLPCAGLGCVPPLVVPPVPPLPGGVPLGPPVVPLGCDTTPSGELISNDPFTLPSLPGCEIEVAPPPALLTPLSEQDGYTITSPSLLHPIDSGGHSSCVFEDPNYYGGKVGKGDDGAYGFSPEGFGMQLELISRSGPAPLNPTERISDGFVFIGSAFGYTSFNRQPLDVNVNYWFTRAYGKLNSFGLGPSEQSAKLQVRLIIKDTTTGETLTNSGIVDRSKSGLTFDASPYHDEPGNRTFSLTLRHGHSYAIFMKMTGEARTDVNEFVVGSASDAQVNYMTNTIDDGSNQPAYGAYMDSMQLVPADGATRLRC